MPLPVIKRRVDSGRMSMSVSYTHLDVYKRQGYVSDNLTLVVDDVGHQFRICLFAHRFIAVAAHSDGYNLFSSLHSLNAFTEELLQVCLVLLIVPWSPSLDVYKRQVLEEWMEEKEEK